MSGCLGLTFGVCDWVLEMRWGDIRERQNPLSFIFLKI